MKHLREYIRHLILESSSIHPKINAQLEKFKELGYTVQIGQLTSLPKGSKTSPDKFYKAGSSIPFRGKVTKDTIVKSVRMATGFGAVQISVHNSSGTQVGYFEAAVKENQMGNCNGAMIISGEGTKMSDGLGPLGYDLLFEISSILGFDGIGPDTRKVSSSAKAVWDYYLNNRSDVIAKQRDILAQPQTPQPEDDCYAGKSPQDRFRKDRGIEPITKGIRHKASGFGTDDWTEAQEYHPEFIDYFFDPQNSLTKTYHKSSKGTPIIDQMIKYNLFTNPNRLDYFKAGGRGNFETAEEYKKAQEEE